MANNADVIVLKKPIIPILDNVVPARKKGFVEKIIVNIVNPIPPSPPAIPTLNGE